MCEQDITLTVYQALKQLDIPYTVTTHEPAATMQDCAAIEAVIGAPICKNLFLCNRQQTAFYLLLMPGNKPFKTKYLSEQIGSSRLSFASAEQMQALLHVTPGSASPFCLLFDPESRIRLLIDRDLLQEPFCGCHPCKNTATVRIAAQSLLENFVPSTGHSYTAVTLPEVLPQE